MWEEEKKLCQPKFFFCFLEMNFAASRISTPIKQTQFDAWLPMTNAQILVAVMYPIRCCWRVRQSLALLKVCKTRGNFEHFTHISSIIPSISKFSYALIQHLSPYRFIGSHISNLKSIPTFRLSINICTTRVRVSIQEEITWRAQMEVELLGQQLAIRPSEAHARSFKSR
jgi:hypothetical protein